MGGPRQRGWAPVGLRSCFLSGLLGRMGGRGEGAEFSLGSLYNCERCPQTRHLGHAVLFSKKKERFLAVRMSLQPILVPRKNTA